MSESTSWGLGSMVKSSVSLRYLGSSITLEDLIWGTNSQLSAYKSHSSAIPHLSLTNISFIPGKCSLLQKNFRENQPAYDDCSLPDEETKGIRWAFWQVFKAG